MQTHDSAPTSGEAAKAMIARMWRGWTTTENAATYAEYVSRTGLAAYRATPGNRGAWILQRDIGGRTEIVTLSLWESLDAVAQFAGHDVTKAVFYPEDDQYLVDRELAVTHYHVIDGGAADHRAVGRGQT
jgi:heme-degrading monooxygenase HmoA